MENDLIRDHQTIFLTGEDEREKRAELLRYFDQTWRLYAALFQVLQSSLAKIFSTLWRFL